MNNMVRVSFQGVAASGKTQLMQAVMKLLRDNKIEPSFILEGTHSFAVDMNRAGDRVLEINK